MLVFMLENDIATLQTTEQKVQLSKQTLPFALHYLYRESNDIFSKVLIFSQWHNLGIIRFELSAKFDE